MAPRRRRGACARRPGWPALLVPALAAVQLCRRPAPGAFSACPAVHGGGGLATASFVRASRLAAGGEDHLGSKLRRRLREAGVRAPSVHLNATASGATIKRLLHVGRFPVMWKEEWIGPANLDRAYLRITGMETYAIVAAVLLQVILGIYGSISEPAMDDPRIIYPRLQRVIFEAQMVLLMIAVLCSTYTMVMYLLIKIYSVTALGLYKDVAYRSFTLATGRLRSHAFWALISSIITFLMAFAMSLYAKVKGNRGIALSVSAMCFVLALLWEGSRVLMAVDDHIFNS